VIRLVGLGLGPPEYVTLKALKALEASDTVYLDCYTSPIPREMIEFLTVRLGDKLRIASRRRLEEEASRLLYEATTSDVAVAVAGDPLIATTHIALLVEAARMGIGWEVVYGVSSVSAAIAASCLSPYRFGRTVTVPREASPEMLRQIYRRIEDNLEAGLHTLALMDVSRGGLAVGEAVEGLLQAAPSSGGLFSPTSPVIVLARLGYPDELRITCRASEVAGLSTPPPPHVLVIPAELRSYEREAVRSLMRVGDELLEHRVGLSSRLARVERYIEKTSRVVSELRSSRLEEEARRLFELAESYVEDARSFLKSQMIDEALAAVSYAEGLLDALRMMGKVEFTW